MSRRLDTVSRLLAYVLRHAPDEIGVDLDDAGWADIPTLLSALARHGTPVAREELAELVITGAKDFALSDDGESIRALHGHSVRVKLPPAAR